MNIDLTTIVAAGALVLGTGGVLAYFRAPKRPREETKKMIAETTVLTDTQQIEKDRFCQEQLEILEKKFRDLQIEFDGYRKSLKELSAKLDETEIKYHKALNTITFLNIELAAYKT